MSCVNQSNCAQGGTCFCPINETLNNPFIFNNNVDHVIGSSYITLHVYEINGVFQELENLRQSFDELVQTHNGLLIECQSWRGLDPQMLIIPSVWPATNEIIDFNHELSCLQQKYESLRLTHKRVLIERKRWRQQKQQKQ